MELFRLLGTIAIENDAAIKGIQKTVNEAESKALTVESGATVSEDRTLSSGQEQGSFLQSHIIVHKPFLSCSKISSFLKNQRTEVKRKKNVSKPIMLPLTGSEC